jgi:putative ABC transport system ATP-binding protein
LRREIITIEGLSRLFKGAEGEFEALKEINLKVFKGECIILKGVSGSGKSTLLNIIGGVDYPTSGRVVVDGEEISKIPDNHLSHFRATKVGMVFQHFNLIENFTVRDNIIAPLVPHQNISLSQAFKMADEVMMVANISHKSFSPVAKLSGGEKQRVAIARALINRPEVILCDEPTANLDRDNSLKFIGILKTLLNLKKSVVVATHDTIFDDLPFPNRVIEIEDGRVGKS